MFKYALALAAIVAIGGIAAVPTGNIGIAQDEPQSMTVRGQIWDSTCAAASSHGKMMTTTKAKDAKECTLNCVKAGAQLVLYNTDDKTTYRLDTQDKVKEYAGQMVTVIGSYDRSTGVLHVDRVETVM
jgi:hypothetical protein